MRYECAHVNVVGDRVLTPLWMIWRGEEPVQLSSDALAAYTDAVERGFGANVDYGQISKTFSVANLGNFKEAASRYSPAEVVRVEKTAVQGMPDVTRISTSRIEKQNHTLRMHCRRG